MRLLKFIILWFFLSLPLFAFDGPERKPAGIIMQSNLAQPLTDSATATAQAYFTHLNEEYFKLEKAEPLKVYLSLTLADARSLIESHGLSAEAGDGFYVPSMNAAYAYLKENADDRISWDGLFLPVAEYYVHQRFATAPLWFKYGLITSLSKNARINDKELVLSGPCPNGSLILLEEDKKGTRLNIKKLFGVKDETFKKSDDVSEEEGGWEIGKPFARLLFYWLYKTGHLSQYITSVYNQGCELDVLQETASANQGRINMELTKFIRNDCNAIASLTKAEQTDDIVQKEALLTEAINLIPDCWQARLALARLYYKSDRKSQCRQILEPLLIRDDEIFYFTAAKIEAACLYDNGDYAQALECYQRVWDKNSFYPYRYQVAYKIANCNHYLDKSEEAGKWYAKFLNLNWSDADAETIEYAEKYVETFGKCKHKGE